MSLNQRSEERLAQIDPKLAAVVREAAKIYKGNFIVTEGLRTIERQRELYAQGRTQPGRIVTWTMQSKHIDGLAVDLAPVHEDGSIDWNDRAAFNAVALAMFEAALLVGTKIRWGADWNQNGKPGEKGETDSPHFEVAS